MSDLADAIKALENDAQHLRDNLPNLDDPPAADQLKISPTSPPHRRVAIIRRLRPYALAQHLLQGRRPSMLSQEIADDGRTAVVWVKLLRSVRPRRIGPRLRFDCLRWPDQNRHQHEAETDNNSEGYDR
jgi:hypothetical protein